MLFFYSLGFHYEVSEFVIPPVCDVGISVQEEDSVV